MNGQEKLMAEEIKVEDVISVYSGRPGCCCGCNGKHTYASKYIKEASEERGYEVTPDEVNDRVVKMMVNKINHAFRDGKKVVEEGELRNFFFWDTGTRWYIAYMNN